MPEGHTVHRLAAEHQRMFGGRRVAVSSPQGRIAEGAARLDGRVLVAAYAQWAGIWDDLVVLMAAGVRDGRIDPVRPEHAPEAMGRPPRVDGHGGEVYVYRRAGRPCLVCGAEVRTVELAARNLFWCPGCQPPVPVGEGGAPAMALASSALSATVAMQLSGSSLS